MKPDSFLMTKAHKKILVQGIVTLAVCDSYEEAGTLLEQYRANLPSVELSAAPDAASCPACGGEMVSTDVCLICQYLKEPRR